jgi:hypothetical protein
VIEIYEIIGIGPVPIPVKLGAPDLIDVPDKTWFEVRIEPKVEGLTFDPMEVSFALSDGETLQSAGFLGPSFEVSYWMVRKELPSELRGFRDKHLPCSIGSGIVQTAKDRIVLSQPSCFYIFFPRPPYPDMDFSLYVKGIRQYEELVRIPVIQYEKGMAWSCHVVSAY